MKNNIKFEKIIGKTIVIKILVYLIRNNKKKSFVGNLYRNINVTHGSVFKLVKRLEDEGLLVRKREGREGVLSLTKKGKIVAEKLQEIEEVL